MTRKKGKSMLEQMRETNAATVKRLAVPERDPATAHMYVTEARAAVCPGCRIAAPNPQDHSCERGKP